LCAEMPCSLPVKESRPVNLAIVLVFKGFGLNDVAKILKKLVKSNKDTIINYPHYLFVTCLYRLLIEPLQRRYKGGTKAFQRRCIIA
jgi:hypothetical protein